MDTIEDEYGRRMRHGKPPLHISIAGPLCPHSLNWLLDRGADPNVQDGRGMTALHEAVFFDSPNHSAMRALLDRGAVMDARGNGGETPLHLAAFLSRAATAEVLLAAGADPNARSDLGKTPLPQCSESSTHRKPGGGRNPHHSRAHRRRSKRECAQHFRRHAAPLRSPDRK